MATLVKSFAIQGIDAFIVDIEIKTMDGMPSISVIGLGDLAVKEAAERIESAIVNILASRNRDSGAVETYILDTETAFDWLNYHS